jgi:hypothetical protein
MHDFQRFVPANRFSENVHPQGRVMRPGFDFVNDFGTDIDIGKLVVMAVDEIKGNNKLWKMLSLNFDWMNLKKIDLINLN